MGEIAASSVFEPRDREDPAEPTVEPHLRALQAATTELTRLRTVKRIAEVASAAAEDGVGARVLVVAILDEEGRRLRVAYAAGLRSEARQRLSSIPLGGPSLLAQVARSGRPVCQTSSTQEDRKRDGRPVRALRPSGESVAMLPLPSGEGPLGVIVFGRSGDYGFSDADKAFLSVLATLGALALERLRLSAQRAVVHPRDAVHVAGKRHRVGRLSIDLEQMQIEVDGRSAHLTPMEMRLLMFLAEEPGRPQTRGEILRHLWQTEHVGGERACDAHIWNLRRKIERDPAQPEILVTRRGIGYALDVKAS